MSSRLNVWADTDPGHDDATLLLMALNLPRVNVMGVSTTHGNAPLHRTTINAARCIVSFCDPAKVGKIALYEGASKPLIRIEKNDPEIHGEDGLGGVEGLYDETNPTVKSMVDQARATPAIIALAQAIQSLPEDETLSICATGVLTNIALFVAVYPQLLKRVDQIVIMGGAVGVGNRSPTAEYNIMADPEAAAIVLDAEVKVVLVPLNVTHTALFTADIHHRLLQPDPKTPFDPSLPLPAAATPLRHTLSTMLNFFAESYKQVFGFDTGPPVHDPLTLAYLLAPELFKGTRYRVDVELAGVHTAGTTSVDLWDYKRAELTDFEEGRVDKQSWGSKGKNCFVTESVDVPAFWAMFQQAVDAADKVSPLNL